MSEAFAPDLLGLAITGRISDEEWRRRIAERLAKQVPAILAEKAVARWSAPAGRIDPEVLALVQACRQRVSVCLLTNATTRLRTDLDRLGVSGEFDFVVNSAEVGVSKPHPGIFQAALHLTGVQPTETFYVDDTPGHIASAAQLGIHGHVFQGLGRLTQALTEYGVLPPSG